MNTFKKIPNSRYIADIFGNIYNKGKKLSLSVNYKGYLRCKIRIEGKIKTMATHRAIAMTFIPNPDDKPIVNHKDGNKRNNLVSNLEWCTAKENSRHAVDQLGIGIGETHSQAKVSEDLVRKICKDLEDGRRNIDIAKKYNLPREMISRIRRGVNWGHVVKEYNISLSRSKTISDKTFLWICYRLEEGLSYSEIVTLSNVEITKEQIRNIKKRKMRPELSKGFKF